MSFTHFCFVRKNSQYIKDNLKRLGYVENDLDTQNYEWIACNHNMFITVSQGFERLFKEDVDCGENVELFLAVAAIRDDNDYMQWFTDGEHWFKCVVRNFDENLANWLNNNSYKPYHKADLNELFEHFKL